MEHRGICGIIFGAVVVIICPAWADAEVVTTITFGNVAQDIGDRGPFTESGYQYDAVGASWSIQKDYLDFVLPDNALTTFWGIPPAVGNTITFTRVDGGTFSFRSIDIFGRLQGAINDVVQAHGLLNGTEVASLTLQSSLQAFTTIQAGPSFDTPIDTLRLEQIQSHGSSLIMDNLVLSQVPEPASVALIAVAAPALLARRPRRS